MAKASKRKRKGGRPLKQGVPRVPGSGRISRSAEAQLILSREKAMEYRLMMEAATWKRRQIDPSLTVEKARQQEHGSVIHRWEAQHSSFRKRYGEDKPDPMCFTQHDRQICENIQEAYERYRAAIASRNVRSSSDFSGPGGFDGRDPFDEDREKRDKRAIEKWKAMRTAILNSGPLGMMAVEAIVIENKPLEGLIGDLRLALNAVERMNRIAKAA